MFFRNKEKDDTSRKIPYAKEIRKIHEYHQTLEKMTQEELTEQTLKLRAQKSLSEENKIRAYAIIFEVIKRTLGMTPYDVQIAGGLALSEGNIAQMRTGEGKTITALFPSFWGYIANLQTYVITVNEYLAERDYLQAKTVFDYLNIEIGLILREMDTFEKKSQYQKPVVYVTNSEFAFDYLRDNIASHAEYLMQGELDFAIIDEADLVLIDEAKNPVIISGSSSENIPNILKANDFVQTLTKEDYEMDKETFIPYLTEQGFEKAREFFGYELYEKQDVFHAVRQSLMAHVKFKLDVDYIVRDGEVLIVDKFTGRILPGRRFQQGLHQAIEAKEGVEIQPENVPVATVTYQNLFRKFKLLSGMTGTGIESKSEFKEIYRMDVKVIPTNKPVKRVDHNDIMFKTKKDKYEYLLKVVKEKHEKGQPLLIGTVSVKESEEVSELLTKANLSFQLLNAKNDREEARIVEQAGQKGAITIATNMAGRGTDIKLTEEVEALGGLCVIGVSRNESKRIDRQLRGRSGRQGQAGESMFFTSIEDEFLVMHPTHKFEKFVKKNKEYPVTKELATKLVDEIQEAMDSLGISVRKFQFQMDEILHYQREYLYGIRKKILKEGLPLETVRQKMDDIAQAIVEPYAEQNRFVADWDIEKLKREVEERLGIVFSAQNEEIEEMEDADVIAVIKNELNSFLTTLEEKVDKNDVQVLLKETSLEMIDKAWTTFLQEVEDYKQGFALSATGEQDPIRKFSMDMDGLFKKLMKEYLVQFFSILRQRADALITIQTHHFFTVFPMKNSYLFKLNLDSDNPKEVTAVLYGERGIVDQFHLSGTTDVIIMIPYALAPGKYVIKNYVDGKEISKIGFKVITESVEEIDEETPSIFFRIPLEEIQPIKMETNVYTASITHVPTNRTYQFELPSENEWVNIEKPENETWMIGRYVITLYGAGLPLYHKEYLVYPKEMKEVGRVEELTESIE